MLNKAKIGKNCLIGAGAIIPEGREIPDGSLVIGIGKIVRELTLEEIQGIHSGTEDYVKKGRLYKESLKQIS